MTISHVNLTSASPILFSGKNHKILRVGQPVKVKSKEFLPMLQAYALLDNRGPAIEKALKAPVSSSGSQLIDATPKNLPRIMELASRLWVKRKQATETRADELMEVLNKRQPEIEAQGPYQRRITLAGKTARQVWKQVSGSFSYI